MKSDISTPTRILRLPTVIQQTGLSRSTVYAWVAAEQFPRPIALGPRAVGWIASEIDEWLERRVAGRRTLKSDKGRRECR